MRNNIKKLIVGCLAGLIFSLSGVAGATSGHWYNWEWAPGNNPLLKVDNFGMPPPFDTSVARSEMKSGRLAWNATSAAVNIDSGTDFNFCTDCDIDNVQDGVIVMTESTITDTDILARMTRRTVAPLHIHVEAALIEFDYNNEPWHVSSGTGIDNGEFDLRSVATHELGHAMGLQHININCTLYGVAETMCADMLPALSNYGVFYRTINTHERDDYVAKYA